MPGRPGIQVPGATGTMPLTIATENSALPGQQVNPGAVGAMTNGVAGDMGVGLAPLSGWAGTQGFNPAELNANIYDSPFGILPQIMEGLDPSTPGYQTLRDFGADPVALFNMSYGAQGTPQGGPGEFANWYANLIQNIGSSGGQWFDGPGLMNNLFNAPEGSSLDNILGVGNASQQARTMFNLFRDATNVSMNPLAARAQQSAMAQAADSYLNAAMTTDSNQIKGMTEYLRERFPQLTGAR